jgi:hypothetical protein
LVAVDTATTAIRFRFGAVGLLGAVTAGAVAVAASGGRLLAPGWPTAGGATRIAPDAAGGVIGNPREGVCSATDFAGR